MVIYIGVGGGSDLDTSRVLALWMKVQNPVFITIFRPLMIDSMIDLGNTILKYTGLPYMQNGVCQPCRAEYKSNRVVSPRKDVVYFCDDNMSNVFGLLLDGSGACEDICQFNKAFLAQLCATDSENKTIAVDTGGDALRGLVPGMGDRDISHLYDGVMDNRDRDALLLAAAVVDGPLALYVFGPGSDGETTTAGLKTAHQSISTLQKDSTSSCSLKHRGQISSMSSLFPFIPAWSSPTRGSTLSNILNALDKPTEAEVPIIRRGKDLGSIPAFFLQEYWVFEVQVNGIVN